MLCQCMLCLLIESMLSVYVSESNHCLSFVVLWSEFITNELIFSVSIDSIALYDDKILCTSGFFLLHDVLSFDAVDLLM